jgi:hypothetical protein
MTKKKPTETHHCNNGLQCLFKYAVSSCICVCRACYDAKNAAFHTARGAGEDEPGRTMAEAKRAGDWFQLELVDTVKRTLSMPGCRGLKATLSAAIRYHRWPVGVKVRAYRVLPQSEIGAMFLEDMGEHTLPEVG